MTKFGKIIVFLFLAVVLIAVAFFLQKSPESGISTLPENQNETTDTSVQILGNKNDLVSFSVLPGETVSGKMLISGKIKGGYFFEANIGVNILDKDKKLLFAGYGTAVGEWMTTLPVLFESSLDFSALPQGPAFIEIHNDNASGLPENDKSIQVPVIIVQPDGSFLQLGELKTISRDEYTFQAPAEWITSSLIDFNGCVWDGLSNDTSDGLRMAGEIGIYPSSCFNLDSARGKREYTKKDGYYIVAFYDKETGTTALEEEETRLVYQKVVDTFSLKNN